MSETLFELTNGKYLCEGLFVSWSRGPAGGLAPGRPVSRPANVGDKGFKVSLLKINVKSVVCTPRRRQS